jgi:dipeptidase
MKKIFLLTMITLFLWSGSAVTVFSCTNILVSRGATTDGSVIITYTCDGEFLPHLTYTPAADHLPGEYLTFRDRNGHEHRVPQPSHTYAVVGLMNEFQVSFGETTFDGRPELRNPDGALHYWTLMTLTLQRAKTAREAIQVIAALTDEYGYASTGESFSLADPDEVWIMEIVGTGPGGKGAIWVARRIPEGYISAHANMSRIGTFPLHDPEHCLYSENVISFAIEKGYYDPDSGEPFRFNRAYDVVDPGKRRYCAARVWSIFRRSAPSLNFPADFSRGVEDAERYPLWIKPDKKLSVQDVMGLLRDHYEGTPYDMTKGVDAGPFGTPNRWRPISWKVDSVEYAWERPISTQQTAFSFVSQARNWLPDPIGGVYWYGMDDTYTTCYFPLYCGITSIPDAYATGSMQHFSWNSAWWVFNFVANIANLKYSYMIKDIQQVQQKLEGEFFAFQPAVEVAVATLYKKDPQLATGFLTTYSVSQGEMVMGQWQQLGKALLTKYNDGYVKDDNGRPRSVGYPEEWLRDVLKIRGDHFRLPVWEKKK